MIKLTLKDERTIWVNPERIAYILPAENDAGTGVHFDGPDMRGLLVTEKMHEIVNKIRNFRDGHN